MLFGIATVLLLIQRYDPLQVYSSWQTQVWNAYQRWGAVLSEPQDPLVFMVQIDNQSIKFVEEAYGEGWPWSRQRYAELLKILFAEYQVGVVGVDIAMPYSRDTSGNDELLALAQQYPLVLPQAFDFSKDENALVTGKISAGIVPPATMANAVLPEAHGYVGLNQQLANTKCVGHVTPAKDPVSGMVTQVPPLIRYAGRLYPILALEMLRCQQSADNQPLPDYALSMTSSANGQILTIKELMGEGSVVQLLLDNAGLWRVPYRIKREDMVGILASDVLQHNVHPDIVPYLMNSMVVIGGSAPMLGDQHPTPLEANAAGMTVHVQMLEWLLSEKTSIPPVSLDVWSWGIGICGLAGLYLLLVYGVGAGTVVLIPLLLALTWLSLGFWVWLMKQWFLPIHPALLFLAFLAIQVPLEWQFAQRTTGRLRKLFQDYLPAPLVGYIVNDNCQDLLLPRKRCLTLLFADIANFTQRAERVTPEVLSELTQQILERLTAVAHHHGGTVDKYMGDAVMVFWNAPFAQDDHADRGVAAAMDMMATIAQFNAEGSALIAGEPIAVRIGVHTGEVVVGDLGTRFRHAYTAIGDAVNVTARLQTLARELQEYLVVSKQTVGLLTRAWPLVSRGDIALKGRQEMVGVYTLSYPPESDRNHHGTED